MRVLIIEGEKKTGSCLQKGLLEHGFVTDLAVNGIDGIHLAFSSPCNLVILNMMLPDRDGWSVIREVRQRGNSIPIVCLSARDSVQERVRALELGADDCLTIPFAFTELLARLKAVLRRGALQAADVIRIGDLEMDLHHHRVLRNGRCIELTTKEFLLLGLLARHPGKVLSRTIIGEQIWDMNFESDSNVIDVLIRRLRKKIEHLAAGPLIHTVRGMGYVLEQRA